MWARGLQPFFVYINYYQYLSNLTLKHIIMTKYFNLQNGTLVPITQDQYQALNEVHLMLFGTHVTVNQNDGRSDVKIAVSNKDVVKTTRTLIDG